MKRVNTSNTDSILVGKHLGKPIRKAEEIGGCRLMMNLKQKIVLIYASTYIFLQTHILHTYKNKPHKH
jgi:hypothetical protein